jgi:V/A-type H+/Na+-transporting ATPase subunit C
VSVLTASPDFVYGNTRLRARKAQLLTEADYEALLGRDLDGVREALTQTAYRPEVESMLARGGGTRPLETAVRDHLARVLGEMRSFYQGRAGELVDVLLSRFDLHNLLTLVRGRARAQPADVILQAVVPIGPLARGAAEEVARRDDAAAAVELLITWRLPDPDTAARLAAAWPHFERTQDLAQLEHELAAAHAYRVERSLARAPETLRELVARERDATNVLTILRLRAALRDEELAELPPPAPDRFLPGGRIGENALEAALHLPAPPDTVAMLADASHRPDWRRPLERYPAGGDLSLLQRQLEDARVRWALRLFLSGDPLGVDVPIAYTVGTENEARNLRTVAESAAEGEPAQAVRARLLIPDGGGRWDA